MPRWRRWGWRKMRKRIALFLAALCLLLAGCQRSEPPPEPSPPPPALPEEAPPAEDPRSLFLDSLTVEVVVDWEDADRMLESLEELSRLLEGALLAADCTVENSVAITIGTAGGITAQALADGGVDAAFLPTEDFAAMEEGAAVGVLMNTDRDFFLAVTAARPELNEDFRLALEEALTATEDGQAFLETCYPSAAFVRAEEGLHSFS